MQISWENSEIGTSLHVVNQEVRPQIVAAVFSLLTESGSETIAVLSAARFNLMQF